VNAEVLEGLFLQTIDKLVWDEELIAQAASEVDIVGANAVSLDVEEEAIQERLGEVGVKLGNVISAIEDGLIGSSVQARLQELENQQAVLKGELADVRTRRKMTGQKPIDVDAARALFQRFRELFELGTREEKELLADAVLKSAIVAPDKTVEFELYVGAEADDVVQNVRFGSPEGIQISCKRLDGGQVRIRGQCVPRLLPTDAGLTTGGLGTMSLRYPLHRW
jgi:hypothetical protein